MRILHVITSLDTGGAENMLVKLVHAMRPGPHEFRVVSLKSKGTLGAVLASEGVTVDALGAAGGILWPYHWLNLGRLVRTFDPDLVHCWMYHANVAAQFVTPRRVPVITSVRGALHAAGANRLMLRAMVRLDALLSARAAAIVFNSQVSARQHAQHGYCEERMIRIPNGFDTDAFRPDRAARERVRAALGVPPADWLIGVVGRFHPIKGHDVFLRAAATVAAAEPAARFLLAGPGCTRDNPRLAALCAEHPALAARLLLLGERSDLADIYQALDLLVNPARSESFPNVVGEAMACGIPCLVTDVGDCATIVADSGMVVPPGDASRIARSVADFIALPTEARVALGSRARERVQRNYSLSRVATEFTTLYENVCARRAAATRI